MNDLRLVLLGIGLSIIVVIYVWGTFKQKSQDRSRTRKITSFKRDSFADVKTMPTYDEDDEVSVEALAEMDKFLANSKLTDTSVADLSLRTKTEDIDTQDIKLSKSVPDKTLDTNMQEQKIQNVEGDQSTYQAPHQIVSFLIKASPNKEFSGTAILEATAAVGLKFGNMNIFHHHGVDGMETEEAIFSLASMYEPGNFELDKMKTYQTKGLTLFMQLPAPIDSMSAFDLMQETAMGLADILQGEIWSSQHEAIDEKALQAMRNVIAESS
jgi:cell division protein ZipA